MKQEDNMIRKAKRDDVLDIANLAVETTKIDEYKCYTFDKLYNTQRLIDSILYQLEGNLNHVVLVDEIDGKIAACLKGQTYYCSYGGDLVMNVDDVVVDYTLGREQNGKSTLALINKMEEHCKAAGIKHWRADSNHSEQMAKSYIHFLANRFEGRLLYGFKAEIK